MDWLSFSAQLTSIGYDESGFSFDNERPAHKVFINDFSLASRLVTNKEYLAFIEDDAYQNPELWLADGWTWLQSQQRQHPAYWVQRDRQWFEYSLEGLHELDPYQPVIHVNYYEANAYATWLGVRLPTEYEWELAVRQTISSVEYSGIREREINLSPQFHDDLQGINQAFGHAWQWTSSSYNSYPGFKPFAGVAGEYNGKFMSNQYVLRGSSCVTPQGHARFSYRNFFYSHQDWQFMGIRLAK